MRMGRLGVKRKRDDEEEVQRITELAERLRDDATEVIDPSLGRTLKGKVSYLRDQTYSRDCSYNTQTYCIPRLHSQHLLFDCLHLGICQLPDCNIWTGGNRTRTL